MGFGQAISAGFSNYVNFPRSGLPVVELLDTELIRGRTAGPPA